jgi:hypothetical protein
MHWQGLRFARNSDSDGVPPAASMMPANAIEDVPLNPTHVYVDADACPVKDEIYRVAIRSISGS